MQHISKSLVLGVTFHYDLWTKYVGIAWDRQSFDQKLVWLFCGFNTIGAITLLQIGLLSK